MEEQRTNRPRHLHGRRLVLTISVVPAGKGIRRRLSSSGKLRRAANCSDRSSRQGQTSSCTPLLACCILQSCIPANLFFALVYKPLFATFISTIEPLGLVARYPFFPPDFRLIVPPSSMLIRGTPRGCRKEVSVQLVISRILSPAYRNTFRRVSSGILPSRDPLSGETENARFVARSLLNCRLMAEQLATETNRCLRKCTSR